MEENVKGGYVEDPYKPVDKKYYFSENVNTLGYVIDPLLPVDGSYRRKDDDDDFGITFTIPEPMKNIVAILIFPFILPIVLLVISNIALWIVELFAPVMKLLFIPNVIFLLIGSILVVNMRVIAKKSKGDFRAKFLYRVCMILTYGVAFAVYYTLFDKNIADWNTNFYQEHRDWVQEFFKYILFYCFIALLNFVRIALPLIIHFVLMYILKKFFTRWLVGGRITRYLASIRR